MEAWMAGIFVFMASGFSAIWYRLGKIEQHCKDACVLAGIKIGKKGESTHE